MKQCECCGSIIETTSEVRRMDDIKAYEYIKRAIEVAAVRHHSLCLIGGRETRGVMDDLSGVTYEYGVPTMILELCPCGGYGSKNATCTCPPSRITRHQSSKRFHRGIGADIIIEVAPLPTHVVASKYKGEPDERVAERIEAARKLPTPPEDLDSTGEHLMKTYIRSVGVDDKRRQQIVSVSQSIAMLAGEDRIQPAHLAEAMQYSPGHNRLWNTV